MNQLGPGLSGYTIIHNGVAGDYCFKEAILSLLPICKEVVVGHAESNDGTNYVLEAMAKEHPKIRIINQPWEQPFDDPRWFVRWINATRKHLRYKFQVMLDADEVLDEKAYPIIREHMRINRPLWFRRINFYRNARTVIGEGETCGHEVARFGPSAMFMPSDEPYGDHKHPGPEPEIRRLAVRTNPMPIIYHYGFLRKREGMIEKCKVNLPAFLGQWDVRMSKMMMHPDKPWHDFLVHKRPYTTYHGPHPTHCHEWLKERGAI